MSTPNPKPKNPNRGYLAPNKKANERQPDWRGKVTVEGKEFLASGWFKDVTNQQGETARIISMEFTDPATLPARPAQADQSSGAPAAQQRPANTPAAAPAADAGSGNFDDIFGGSSF